MRHAGRSCQAVFVKQNAPRDQEWSRGVFAIGVKLTIRMGPPTPGLRYAEDPDASRDRSGSSAYLRPGVGCHDCSTTRIERLIQRLRSGSAPFERPVLWLGILP